ncbi:hypothetical protein [Simkania sp.]|uniref:hypothetical protein n=1 Tax=Simkania sp. TaxID=34094 RepID=UPI003B516114
MATIDFSLPLWGTCQARTTYEGYEYLQEAQKHSVEEKTEDFSRVKPTAYLLLSVAMTFFHGLALESKALGEGGLYYFSNETESAKKAFTENGKDGLKTLGFSLYQLFLACVALLNPSEVKSRITLPEVVEPKYGLFSKEPTDVTNRLMIQIEALRRQNEFLKSQIGAGAESALSEVFQKNLESEELVVRVGLEAQRTVEDFKLEVESAKKELEEKDQVMKHEKELDEERLQEVQKKLDKCEHFWKYFQHALSPDKELSKKSAAQILQRLNIVWAQPHLIRDYAFD